MRSKENPGNPKFELFHSVKMAPKWGIPTYRDQNLICSEGGKNTSASQSLGHSYLVFSRKCPEIAHLVCVTKSKCLQTKENQQKMIKI